MTTPIADPMWERIRQETMRHAGEEPILASFLHATILNHAELELALSFHLASQLDSSTASSLLLRDVILEAFNGDPEIRSAVRADLQAVEERDSACHELYIPFLYFKGFHALQTYRVAHWLWTQGAGVPGAVFPEPHVGGVRRGYPPGGAPGARHHAGSRHRRGDRGNRGRGQQCVHPAVRHAGRHRQGSRAIATRKLATAC